MPSSQPDGADQRPPSPDRDRVTAAALAADPGLVEALRTARAWGAPPSVFAGTPKRSRTTYMYDEAGRLVETWTVHEPLWTDDDRAYALALAEYEADLCQCGRPLSETMDPAHEFAYRGELAGRCHACTAQEAAAAPYGESPHPGALRFRTTLDPVRAAAGRARVEAERDERRGADGAGAAGAGVEGAEGDGRPGPAPGTHGGPGAGGEADDGGRAAELSAAVAGARGAESAGGAGADERAAEDGA